MILEDDRGKIAINPNKFDKLITSLRTAVDMMELLIKKPHHTMTYLMPLGWHSSFTIMKIVAVTSEGYDNAHLFMTL